MVIRVMSECLFILFFFFLQGDRTKGKCTMLKLSPQKILFHNSNKLQPKSGAYEVADIPYLSLPGLCLACAILLKPLPSLPHPLLRYC